MLFAGWNRSGDFFGKGEEHLNRNVIILIISMFFVASGYTMVIPFLPLYLTELGVPEDMLTLWSGLVFSICFLVAGIMGPIWGKMADNRGKKMMALRAAVLLGVSYVLCGLSQNEYQLLGARAFQGFANGFVAAAMALIADNGKSEKLGITLGFAQTALVVGGIVGPLIGGFLSYLVGMKNTFFISGIILWIVSAATAVFIKDGKTAAKADREQETSTIWEDLRFAFGNHRLKELLLISFFLQCTILMIQSVTTIYIGGFVEDKDNVELVAGMIMSCGGLAGALTTALWGKIGQARGYYLTMSITLLSAGVITAAQSLPGSVYGVGICQFLVGCFIIGTNPSLNASLVQYTPAAFRGRIFGLSNMSQQFGNMCGPLMATAVASFLDVRSVYVAAGIIQFLLGFRLFRNHIWKADKG